MNVSERVSQLIVKHLHDELTEIESIELHQWINASEKNRELFDRLTNEETFKKEVKEFYSSKTNSWKRIVAAIKEDQQKAKHVNIRRIWMTRAAAVILILLVGAATYFFISRPKKTQQQLVQQPTDISAPDANHAILTIGNKKIVLDNAGIGKIATDGAVDINKIADGQIIYKGSDTDIQTHILAVPRGSQPLAITLSDGTHVTLNAGSTIVYPSSFTGSERRMEVAGEAYFEVAHDASRPFIVKKSSSDVEVKVLGTHFNINAYDDESAIKVTLLEGKVEVGANQNSVVIKPGQQAVVGGSIKVIDDVDVDVAMAWKNGLFNLKEVNIKDIMRQVSRFYDAEIVYEGDVSDIGFYGIVSRRKNVSALLNIMEKTGAVHFRIEGKRIIVSK